jgi:LuxR family transcriptional regulator, regulator of acetate metabolism
MDGTTTAIETAHGVPDGGAIPDRAELRARLDLDGAGIDDLVDLVVRDGRERDAVARRHRAEFERIVAVHDAMTVLRACPDAASLVRATPAALCRAGGFTRAMISEVRGSVWDPKAVEIRDGCDPRADEFRAFVEEAEIPLEHLLLEADLVRRRVPALVRDPAHDPRTSPVVVEMSRTTSYVAAPIMPTGRVIGFLHADRFGGHRACDEADRDTIWVFAEHMGLIYERAALVERMEEQRLRLARAMAEVSAAVEELSRAEITLADPGHAADVAASNVPARGARQDPAAMLLTDREREVLDLLVTGTRNADIARVLVIAESTVKSHVERILRKLRARTRAEAVATYLRLRGSNGPSA